MNYTYLINTGINLAIMAAAFFAGVMYVNYRNKEVSTKVQSSKNELLDQFKATYEEVIHSQSSYLASVYNSNINTVKAFSMKFELLREEVNYIVQELTIFENRLQHIQELVLTREELENEIIKLKNIIKRLEKKNA